MKVLLVLLPLLLLNTIKSTNSNQNEKVGLISLYIYGYSDENEYKIKIATSESFGSATVSLINLKKETVSEFEIINPKNADFFYNNHEFQMLSFKNNYYSFDIISKKIDYTNIDCFSEDSKKQESLCPDSCDAYSFSGELKFIENKKGFPSKVNMKFQIEILYPTGNNCD